MKKLLLTFFMTFMFGCNLSARDNTRNNNFVVKSFIGNININEREELADNCTYPLGRPRQAVRINSREDFLANYDVLFDKGFIKMIVSSDPKSDWDAVGVQGIMFKQGEIWLDFDGKLIAINNITKEEQKLIDAAILKDRESLPKSLQNYVKNMLKFQTERYLVRVDLLEDKKFRYAAWKIGKAVATEPDIVLYDGGSIFEGSGGNKYYIFKRDNYRYEIYENVMSDKKPYELKVYKNNEVILSQNSI